jgi:hypothetical protein
VSKLPKAIRGRAPSFVTLYSSGATKGTDYINGFPYFGCNPISPKSTPKVARQKPHKASAPAVSIWLSLVGTDRALFASGYGYSVYMHARVRTAERTQPRVRPAVELIRRQKFHPRRIILSPINIILSMPHRMRARAFLIGSSRTQHA